MVARGLAVALLLACCLCCARAEEAAGALAPGDIVPTTVAGYAGYVANSNVEQHSRIDLDIRAVLKAGSDWEEAKKVYEEGEYSVKGDGSKRTLKSFSTKWIADSASEQGEPLVRLAHEYWGRGDYADAHIMAALEGRDLEGYGMYASGKLASTADARKQIVEKVLQFSSVWLYALHEVESAYKKYQDESLGEARFGFDGAAHALNEGWVFYVGSLEDGSQESGEADDDGKGYGPYILAEKRAPDFQTGGYVSTNGGTSRVNLELMYQFTAMKRYLATPGNTEVIGDILKCIRAQFKVPAIQGCLLYTYKASSPDLTTADTLAKIKAEAWAFCANVLPHLHEVDKEAAVAVKKQVMLDSSDARPDWSAVKNAFTGANINKMGVSCSDIGSLKPSDYGDAYPGCKDEGKLVSTNQYADSEVCGTIRMPDNPSSAAGSRSSWIMLAFVCVGTLLATH